MTDRKIVRVAISPVAKKVVTQYAQKEDMTETGVLSRLYEGFSGQPDVLQDYLLGRLRDGLRAEAFKHIMGYFQSKLDEMAADEDPEIISPNQPPQSPEQESAGKGKRKRQPAGRDS